jgi:hypothetical protein
VYYEAICVLFKSGGIFHIGPKEFTVFESGVLDTPLMLTKITFDLKKDLRLTYLEEAKR